MKRAETLKQIKPLVNYCKTGRLFEVQEWIKAGKPVSLPKQETGRRPKSPLEYAIESGNFSIVQILLEGGASTNEYDYCALEHASEKKRLDIVKLLVDFDADVSMVDIAWVFECSTVQIAEFLIRKGADVENGYPLAQVLIWDYKKVLSVYKKISRRHPKLKKQLNMALRYYCREGDLEWVSLLLKAGANPYENGLCEPNDDPHDSKRNALETAIFYGNYEVLNLTALKFRPNLKKNKALMETACLQGTLETIQLLIDKGIGFDTVSANIIQNLLEEIDIVCRIKKMSPWWSGTFKIDSERTREIIRKIHFFARKGFRWEPEDSKDITKARNSFVQLEPDYIIEFVWIMAGYGTCNLKGLAALVKPKSIQSMLNTPQKRRVERLLESMES
ncbi:MAG: ankyrin repeat domain-containing protein [Desulfotignum sp.]|nr:ankyrin repeat domain-containing protein [Desulfotignum sp.]MCF8089528.1 ankyrin repeat domain-containing protein [Desulfotignum sp.]MCF8135826.1 ankyrin repeat domain-containing protein [Desulfotignum sp.]